ncbi:hypothetical protein BC830DRAFT_166539 [Chytriomyces sp. MP71]|nr:hypothetical protein BC830DRAFT_166539 [Chytriomyces sp. MP71]
MMTDQIKASLRTSGFAQTSVGQRIATGKTLTGKKISDVENELITPGTKFLNYPQAFSNRYTLDFDKKDGWTYFSDFGNLKNLYNANNVVLVSNGNCGSTCAQFITIARDQVGVKAVTYGGGKRRSTSASKNFDPTSYAAGFISDFQVISGAINRNSKRDDAADAKLNPAPFPKFAINMASSIAFATSFSPQGKYPECPIEWVIATSDFYLDGADVKLGDGPSIWSAIVSNGNIFGSNSTTVVAAPAKKNGGAAVGASLTVMVASFLFFVLV